jgi:hypothetical protein
VVGGATSTLMGGKPRGFPLMTVDGGVMQDMGWLGYRRFMAPDQGAFRFFCLPGVLSWT